MSKNRFIKNLYQSLSFGASLAVLILAMLAGFFVSLSYENNNGWLLLVFSAIVIFLFFAIGFYWIFQTVAIDKQGIKVKIMRKTIRDIPWDHVTAIQTKKVMKNPAYVLSVRGEKALVLDKRKAIKTAIEIYSNENVKLKIQLL